MSTHLPASFEKNLANLYLTDKRPSKASPIRLKLESIGRIKRLYNEQLNL